MNCPNCKNVELVEVLTTKGVLVDICPRCRGIWLDKGEIFYFTSKPDYLNNVLQKALKDAVPSPCVDPKTGGQLVDVFLPEWELHIDYSPQSEGIWLDKGELERLPGGKLEIKIDNSAYIEVTPPESKEVPTGIRLPNLGLVSSITIFALYAILFLFLIILSNIGLISPLIALIIGVWVAIANFLLSPFIMDVSLHWFYRIKWVSYDQLPESLKKFLIEKCQEHKIHPPRVGIIPDGSPNAFTYGHTPNNARIVLTAGIMELLEPEELNSVVAHELGHILHWDMLVMTVAHIVPLILYYIYRSLIRIKSRSKDDSASLRLLIAFGSYLLYLISEYIVLWFSRIREYFADRYAGESTGCPDILAQALVKIGYGLAGRRNPMR
jgi:Zn-dependent protease with chaperone function/Zn-finger nucleic acid-binding protein